MARIAVIDDDPVEVILLSGQAEAYSDALEFEGFTTVEDFLAHPEAGSFDLIFLDRRIPPYGSFKETLPKIEQSGVKAPVVLMSAYGFDEEKVATDLETVGPVSKFVFIEGDMVEEILGRYFPKS
jgi:DNA-binding NtrC family response regulator